MRRGGDGPRLPCSSCVPVAHVSATFLSVTASLALDVVVPGSPETTGNVWLTHEEMETLAASPQTVSPAPSLSSSQGTPLTSGTIPGLFVGNRKVILHSVVPDKYFR